MEPELIEFRCPNRGCGQLLFKVSEVTGIAVEVICHRCKRDGRDPLVKAELHKVGDEN